MSSYNCQFDVDYGISFEYAHDAAPLLASFAGKFDVAVLAEKIDSGSWNIYVEDAGFFLEKDYSTQITFDDGHAGCGDIYEVECGDYLGELLFQTWDYDGRDFSERSESPQGTAIASALDCAFGKLAEALML